MPPTIAPEGMFEAFCAAREIGCSVPVRLAFVVVVLVTVVLAGDVESNPSPSCAICGTR